MVSIWLITTNYWEQTDNGVWERTSTVEEYGWYPSEEDANTKAELLNADLGPAYSRYVQTHLDEDAARFADWAEEYKNAEILIDAGRTIALPTKPSSAPPRTYEQWLKYGSRSAWGGPSWYGTVEIEQGVVS